MMRAALEVSDSEPESQSDFESDRDARGRQRRKRHRPLHLDDYEDPCEVRGGNLRARRPRRPKASPAEPDVDDIPGEAPPSPGPAGGLTRRPRVSAVAIRQLASLSAAPAPGDLSKGAAAPYSPPPLAAPTLVSLPTSADGSKEGSARYATISNLVHVLSFYLITNRSEAHQILQLSCRLDAAELERLGEHRNRAYRTKTVSDYKSQLKKFEVEIYFKSAFSFWFWF